MLSEDKQNILPIVTIPRTKFYSLYIVNLGNLLNNRNLRVAPYNIDKIGINLPGRLVADPSETISRTDILLKEGTTFILSGEPEFCFDFSIINVYRCKYLVTDNAQRLVFVAYRLLAKAKNSGSLPKHNPWLGEACLGR